MNGDTERENIAQELREVLSFARDTIKARARFFNAGMRLQALQMRARMEAEQDAIWRAQGKKVHHRDAEIAEMRRREGTDMAAEVLDKIETIRERLNHSRYNDFQVAAIHRNLCHGMTPLVKWLDAMDNVAPTGFMAEQAPVSIWTDISMSLDPMKEPPPPIPPTWFLKSTDPDKTDQEGKPYYIPNDRETGLPRTDFDPKLLSMTEQAIHWRNQRYAGPTMTAEEYMKAQKRAEKEREEAASQRLALKNAQREQAHKEADGRIMEQNRASEYDRRERDKQREKEAREEKRSREGHISRVTHEHVDPIPDARQQSNFVVMGEQEKKEGQSQ